MDNSKLPKAWEIKKLPEALEGNKIKTLGKLREALKKEKQQRNL